MSFISVMGGDMGAARMAVFLPFPAQRSVMDADGRGGTRASRCGEARGVRKGRQRVVMTGEP
jgi:hypothetical protein